MHFQGPWGMSSQPSYVHIAVTMANSYAKAVS